ncbi:AraC family transcriptional regulator [Paenibacillus ginsengarvi]|uniref:AraC family transcriptional regulator n=1 Tax=Paenibacillus ginsengarvi TaxID=400777 RepID=A0A3B0CBZ5_9BACL|nr:AraC family transcriptional regulator [Paenibacillus ginsengarvi]RKN80506.1 AraC family transcriptional regulator [Paenibacillus ginsengarvi]
MIRLLIDYRRRIWIISAFLLCLCVVSGASLSYFMLSARLKGTVGEGDQLQAVAGAISIANEDGNIVHHKDERMIGQKREDDPVLSKVPLDREEGAVSLAQIRNDLLIVGIVLIVIAIAAVMAAKRRKRRKLRELRPGSRLAPDAAAMSHRRTATNTLGRELLRSPVESGSVEPVEATEPVLECGQAAEVLYSEAIPGGHTTVCTGEAKERDDGESDRKPERTDEDKRSGLERHEVVGRMLVFIQEHYGRSDLSLNLLSEQFKMSLYHLSRIFKEQTGGNFIDYVMGLRMERAKSLLRESGMKIREIAEEVGYTNLNSFVRIFKKTTGFTPTEYRAMESGKAAVSPKTAKL